MAFDSASHITDPGLIDSNIFELSHMVDARKLLCLCLYPRSPIPLLRLLSSLYYCSLNVEESDVGFDKLLLDGALTISLFVVVVTNIALHAVSQMQGSVLFTQINRTENMSSSSSQPRLLFPSLSSGQS